MISNLLKKNKVHPIDAVAVALALFSFFAEISLESINSGFFIQNKFGMTATACLSNIEVIRIENLNFFWTVFFGTWLASGRLAHASKCWLVFTCAFYLFLFLAPNERQCLRPTLEIIFAAPIAAFLTSIAAYGKSLSFKASKPSNLKFALTAFVCAASASSLFALDAFGRLRSKPLPSWEGARFVGRWLIDNDAYAAYAAVLLAACIFSILLAVGKIGCLRSSGVLASLLSVSLAAFSYAYPFASGWTAENSEPLLFAGWLFPITTALALRLFFHPIDRPRADDPIEATDPNGCQKNSTSPS